MSTSQLGNNMSTSGEPPLTWNLLAESAHGTVAEGCG